MKRLLLTAMILISLTACYIPPDAPAQTTNNFVCNEAGSMPFWSEALQLNTCAYYADMVDALGWEAPEGMAWFYEYGQDGDAWVEFAFLVEIDVIVIYNK